MSQYPPKIYAAGVFVRSRDTKIGTIISLGFDLAKFKEFVNANHDNGKINIDLVPRQEKSEKGLTHSAVLNTWKPDPNYKKPEKQDNLPTQYSPPPDTHGDDVPF